MKINFKDFEIEDGSFLWIGDSIMFHIPDKKPIRYEAHVLQQVSYKQHEDMLAAILTWEEIQHSRAATRGDAC